ncbi:MAG: hypothetical protein ACFN4U_04090 [Candidatus Absconditicoccaceae bacterium]
MRQQAITLLIQRIKFLGRGILLAAVVDLKKLHKQRFKSRKIFRFQPELLGRPFRDETFHRFHKRPIARIRQALHSEDL